MSQPATETYCPAWSEHRMIQGVDENGPVGYPFCFWCEWQHPDHKKAPRQETERMWQKMFEEREERLLASLLDGFQWHSAGPEGLRQTVGERWPPTNAAGNDTYAVRLQGQWNPPPGPVPVLNARGEEIGTAIAAADADGMALSCRFPGRSGELLVDFLHVSQLRGDSNLRVQIGLICPPEPEADTPHVVEG